MNLVACDMTKKDDNFTDCAGFTPRGYRTDRTSSGKKILDEGQRLTTDELHLIPYSWKIVFQVQWTIHTLPRRDIFF